MIIIHFINCNLVSVDLVYHFIRNQIYLFYAVLYYLFLSFLPLQYFFKFYIARILNLIIFSMKYVLFNYINYMKYYWLVYLFFILHFQSNDFHIIPQILIQYFILYKLCHYPYPPTYVPHLFYYCY
jgi:hypothetical protein